LLQFGNGLATGSQTGRWVIHWAAGRFICAPRSAANENAKACRPGVIGRM